MSNDVSTASAVATATAVTVVTAAAVTVVTAAALTVTPTVAAVREIADDENVDGPSVDGHLSVRAHVRGRLEWSDKMKTEKNIALTFV